MSDLHALVIIYRGDAPRELDIQSLRDIICQIGTTGSSAYITVLNEEEIAARLSHTVITPQLKKDEEYNEEELAVIYIATKFKDDLQCGTTSERLASFTAHFSAYAASIAFTHADEKMMNALKILSDKPIWNIRQEIRSSYRVNEKILTVISRIGHMVLNV